MIWDAVSVGVHRWDISYRQHGQWLFSEWFQTRFEIAYMYVFSQKRDIYKLPTPHWKYVHIFATLYFSLWQFKKGQPDWLLEKIYYLLDPPKSEGVSRKTPRSPIVCICYAFLCYGTLMIIHKRPAWSTAGSVLPAGTT